ncbi:MAG: hypothetical protein ABSD29_17940 [Verrucomicrobiota bacterium]
MAILRLRGGGRKLWLRFFSPGLGSPPAAEVPELAAVCRDAATRYAGRERISAGMWLGRRQSPFGGGVAPGAGAGGVMAQTWNQYWVPLVRPVTVQLEALPT